jgi:hypothetical protein
METLIAPRIAAMHARSGEPGDALLGFERMLRSFGNATDIAAVCAWRAALIVLFTKIGLLQAAATLHGTLSDLIDAGGVTPEHADAVDRVRNELGERVFATAAARGGAMSLREVSNHASVQVQLAIMAQSRQIAVRACGAALATGLHQKRPAPAGFGKATIGRRVARHPLSGLAQVPRVTLWSPSPDRRAQAFAGRRFAPGTPDR